MNRIVNLLKKQLNIASSGKWSDNRIFVFVDFHGTIMKSDYKKNNIDLYPGAAEMLNMMSTWDRIVLVAWTCSYEDEISNYTKKLEELGIRFDMINNSKQTDSERGCFKQKPYYSILLDDKAGFDPIEDIPAINDYLRTIKSINKQ